MMKQMVVRANRTVPSEVPQMEGLRGVTMKVLFGKSDHAPHFYMREFTVEPGGFTPLHQHDYEHEVYVLSGEGEVEGDGTVERISAGNAVFMPANVLHQFRNTGDQPFRFICMVPSS